MQETSTGASAPKQIIETRPDLESMLVGHVTDYDAGQAARYALRVEAALLQYADLKNWRKVLPGLNSERFPFCSKIGPGIAEKALGVRK